MRKKVSQTGSSSEDSLTLLLLVTDTPVPKVVEQFGDYHEVFTEWLKNSYASLQEVKKLNKSLKVVSYDVVKGEYPTEEDERGAVGVMMTGSASSAYENIPWIIKLTSYIRLLPTRHPNLKIIGICFGHQIIANAFSETGTVKNEKGWELGVKRIEMTELGKELFEVKHDGILNMHQVHRDHVPVLPRSFELLGHNDMTPVHAMVKFSSPTCKKEPSSVQILSVQGHPEFKPQLVIEIINVREAKGILSKEFAEECRISARDHDDGIQIGRTVLKVLGF